MKVDWKIIEHDFYRTWSYSRGLSYDQVPKFPKIKLYYHYYQLVKWNINGFRDVFYYRLQRGGHRLRLLKCFYPPTSNCILDIGTIEGGGYVAHHAFSSYFNIEHVGYGCTFRNNTTFGNKMVNGALKRPYLKNNIFVGPNVVVIGDVTIGNNVVIGAGAVVTKSIPDNCVVVGNPARIISENGIRCNRKL